MPLRPNMQPRDYLEIFLRRKWLIIFSFLFILFVASVYCVVTPELFRSSTTILVIPQRVPENYVRSTVSVKIEDRLATIRQQVQSRTRLVAVMDELGLFKEERKKTPIEGVVEVMRKRITIDVRGNDAFTLSFVHGNRQTAMLTTSRLASFFIDENLKSREQQAVGTAEFLDSQLQETKKKLEGLEERVRRYKSTFIGELPEQLQANLQMMSRLQDQLRVNSDAIRTANDRKMLAESQINNLESQLSVLEAQARAASAGNMDSVPAESASPGDPAAPYLPELNAKRVQLANLSTKYTDRYPEIRRLREEITQLDRRVAEARRSAATASSPPDPAVPHSPASSFLREKEELQRQRAALSTLDFEIKSLKKERADQQRSISAIEEKVGRSPRREQEMIALTRDYDNMKRSYDDLLRKKLDADLSQNLEMRQKGEQFQILDPANLPEDPYVPNRLKVFAVAILVALMAGFGGTIGLEMADPSVRDLAAFRQFSQISILATIPNIQDKQYVRKLAVRKAAVFGGLITFSITVTVFLVVYGEKIRTILQGTPVK